MKGQHSQSSVEISRALKRPRDQNSDGDESQKKHRIEFEPVEHGLCQFEPIAPTNPVPLKLDDINDDCLRRTFQFLSATDLINVAEADGRFIPVATEVFRRCIRKRKIKVVRNPSRCVQNDCIKLNMEVASACFYHFGLLISDLSIDFDGKREITAEQSFQKRCWKSLYHLDLYRCQSDSLETMKKPFVNVRELNIVSSTLGRKMSKMSIWFPNLTNLELSGVEVDYPEFIEVNFPNLKHLTIRQDFRTPNSSVALLLIFNPQLKSLNLAGNCAAELFPVIGRHLVELEQLTVFPRTDRDITQAELDQLLTDSQNLKRLYLTFGQHPFWITELFATNWTIDMQHVAIETYEYFHFTLNRTE